MRIQLGKLQRLAQPYFLPGEESNSWQFLFLLAALLGIVVGLTLLLLTGVVAASNSGARSYRGSSVRRPSICVSPRSRRYFAASG
ncbi:MAG: hypothetical protein EB119_08505, partial [Synechococcaceae bacterium WBB_34_004]|nr:hypothetical protein [Synechococcaceae bacterium WBB_34_004]